MRTRDDMIKESIKRQQNLQDAQKEAETREKIGKMGNKLLTIIFFPVVFVGLLVIGLGSKEEK